MLNRNKGLFGSAPPPPPAQPEQQRPSFFGHNGTGRNIAGSIGDALLQMNGMRPQFAPARQQQQVMDYQTRQAKTEREARMQDWYAQRDYELANPQAPEPDAFERALVGAGIDPRSPEGQALFRDRAASMARDPNDQFVSATIPGQGQYMGPISGLQTIMQGGAARGPQPGAVEDGYRFKGGNPADQNNWEAVTPSAPRQLGAGRTPTRQNTPAPQIGANGLPSQLTRQQYEAFVNDSGGNRAAADDYLARMGIQVRN